MLWVFCFSVCSVNLIAVSSPPSNNQLRKPTSSPLDKGYWKGGMDLARDRWPFPWSLTPDLPLCDQLIGREWVREAQKLSGRRRAAGTATRLQGKRACYFRRRDWIKALCRGQSVCLCAGNHRNTRSLQMHILKENTKEYPRQVWCHRLHMISQ